MPYAGIYAWGRHIQAILGSDGRFDAEWVALGLSQQGATAEDLAALASAEAAWRVDTLVDQAEAAGVSLDPGGTTEIVSPTVSQAVETAEARILCGYRNHRGEGCTNEALEGAGRCGTHGGLITDPEVRRSLIIITYAKIFDGAREAADALLDVAINGRSEMARVQAAKEILDRAGVSQDQHVTIHRADQDASEDDLVDELRRRLLVATDRLRIHALPKASEDDTTFDFTEPGQAMAVWTGKNKDDNEIIDAEIVPEDV